MPFFKIKSSTSSRIMIKSDSVPQIIEAAIKKLKLPDNVEYKLVLENDGTEFDDDEILLEFAKESNETMLLLILPKNTEWNDGVNKENSTSLTNTSISTISTGISVPENVNSPSSTCSLSKVLNLDEIIWNKIPNRIFVTCESGKQLQPRDRKEIIHNIKNYMINSKNTTRTLAGRFARKLCDLYPDTFSDKVGGSKDIWSDGYETLITQIYNCVKYEENCLTKQSKRKKVLVGDSDDEDIEARKNEEIVALKRDEYGCVEYAPDLPSNETFNSQEEKRLMLKELFEQTDSNKSEVLKLMADTYCSQRASINNETRNLNDIIIDWPFLTDSVCFVEHASILLGKKVSEVWNESLTSKAKIIRLFLKVPQNLKAIDFSKVKGNESKKETENKKKKEIDDIFVESKEFGNLNRSKIHKTLVIFPLLGAVFEEKIDALYKVIDKDDNVAEETSIQYPILIIKGNSLYDESSSWSVYIDKNNKISCSDAIQAILIGFLTYYVFGLKYNPSIEKTMEFIQRFFLKINPSTGSKKEMGKKRRRKLYDTSVFNFAKELSNFSDEFKTQ